MTGAPVAARRGGLWRDHDFRTLWIGETTSQVGTSVSSVALPLVAVEVLHTSAFVVTLLAAGSYLPWLIIGLPAGAWVDRRRRRPLLLVCDAMSFIAFASVPVAAWLGVLEVAQLVAVALIAGAASVVFTTAFNAYLPSLIGADDLTEGNAKLTGSASAAQVGGPGLGGAIVQFAGATLGLLANALSFAVSFACLTAIRTGESLPARNTPTDRDLAHELRDGVRFLLADRFLRPLFFLAPPINFFLTALNALTAVFLVRTVGLQPGLVGVVYAAESTGGVLGAVLTNPLAQRFGTSHTAVGAVALCFPFALLIPLTTHGIGVIFYITGGFLVGGGLVITNVLFSSFIQSYVPNDMLGRASASAQTFSYSMRPVGAITAGALTTLLGLRPTFWVLCAGLTITGFTYLTAPMRKTRDFPPPPTPSSDSASNNPSHD